MHTIRLPNGNRCSVSRYVAAWRALRSMPADTSTKGFDHFPAPAGDVLGAMRDGLHDRINRHDPSFGRGRKWSSDWQRAALQTSHAVNTPRLIVRWVPQDLKARLAHRVSAPDDF
jgi:hypothetical protein